MDVLEQVDQTCVSFSGLDSPGCLLGRRKYVLWNVNAFYRTKHNRKVQKANY